MKNVYTLQDLVSRNVLDSGADKPARLAVLGWPIAHSASPQMHQAALDGHSIDARYIRLEVEPGQIPEAFARMNELGFLGCNVTVPHKLDALANCSEVHPDAMALGAVNTVRFEAGRILGFNTDGPGFASAIEQDFGVPLAGLKVAIAGAGGGAGLAIATQCVRSGVSKLVLANRTLSKLVPLSEKLREMNPALEILIMTLDDAALAEQCLTCDLIVNTSSIGLKADEPSILSAACLKKEHRVYDTIYQPPVTSLLALANACGCQTANGLSMLQHQGALAFQHWFPQSEPLAMMQRSFANDSIG